MYSVGMYAALLMRPLEPTPAVELLQVFVGHRGLHVECPGKLKGPRSKSLSSPKRDETHHIL